MRETIKPMTATEVRMRQDAEWNRLEAKIKAIMTKDQDIA